MRYDEAVAVRAERAASTAPTSRAGRDMRVPAKGWGTGSCPARSTGPAAAGTSASAWKLADSWMTFLAGAVPRPRRSTCPTSPRGPSSSTSAPLLPTSIPIRPEDAARLRHQTLGPGARRFHRDLVRGASVARHRPREAGAGEGTLVLDLQRRAAQRSRHRHRRPRHRSPRHGLGRVQTRHRRLLLLARRALAAQRPEARRAQAERVGEPDHVRQPRTAEQDRPRLHQRRRRLLYPGEEKVHPEGPRPAGPVASVQLANPAGRRTTCT